MHPTHRTPLISIQVPAQAQYMSLWFPNPCAINCPSVTLGFNPSVYIAALEKQPNTGSCVASSAHSCVALCGAGATNTARVHTCPPPCCCLAEFISTTVSQSRVSCSLTASCMRRSACAHSSRHHRCSCVTSALFTMGSSSAACVGCGGVPALLLPLLPGHPGCSCSSVACSTAKHASDVLLRKTTERAHATTRSASASAALEAAEIPKLLLLLLLLLLEVLQQLHLAIGRRVATTQARWSWPLLHGVLHRALHGVLHAT
mmetsp:Transcript_29893/g.76120  ORF Transcript_29893/g.76120 Transcript_29893/m.76120 type:complete len:260 (+) Transcript_29893:64-843(+)